MSKVRMFKARAGKHGQRVTVYPFLANPSGDYVDGDSGYPDPEDMDYPDAVPEETYGAAVEVIGFVQPPMRWEGGGEHYIKTAHGEEVPVELVAYLPGDTEITVRDKVVFDEEEYEVLRIRTYQDGDEVVMKMVELRKRLE